MSVINPIIVQAGGIDPSDANAVVGDVLASKTFYAGNETKKTGTMVDRGTVNTDITTKAQEVTIAAGKHSGSGKVKISATEQAKIIAENIKKDVTVLGVTGTYEGSGGGGSYSLTMYVATTPAPPGNYYLYLYYSLDNGLTYSQRVTATSGSPLVIEHVGQAKFKIVSEDGMFHPWLEFNGTPVFSESFFQGEAFSDNMVLTQNSYAELTYGYD